MRKKILEKFLKTRDESKLTHTGKLKIKKKKGKEWGYLIIDSKLWEDRRKKHLIVPDLWTKPDYTNPHISVFTREEVLRLPKDFEHDGKDFKFTLTDTMRIVDPEKWDEVYECAFEPVICYEFEKLRMSLGFTPLMYGRHEFHITLGLKYVKDKK